MNYSNLFRKEVFVKPSAFKLSHKDKILLLGSCFTANISSFLNNFGFGVSYPFGTLYNPITIGNNLQRILRKNHFNETDVVENNDRFYSWNHSSNYSGDNKKEFVRSINEEMTSLNSSLKESSTIIITLGTSFVYKHINYGLVGNCHKLPSRDFVKRMLSLEEMLHCWTDVLSSLENKNIIFTVSPVRHWSDGAIDNTRSKSQLHLLISKLEAEFDNTAYFPSYELMMDELRDYRFYKKDMLHPSHQAVEFIWDKFVNCYFNTSTKAVLAEVTAIRKSLSHKPFNPKSKNHQQFLKKCLQQIKTIQKKTPHYYWEKESSTIKDQLDD